MGNCLVTKLKGVVDNESLPYFNGLVLTLTNNGYLYVLQPIGVACTYKIISNNAVFSTSPLGGDSLGTEITLTGSQDMAFFYKLTGSGDVKVLVENLSSKAFLGWTGYGVKGVNLDTLFQYVDTFEELYVTENGVTLWGGTPCPVTVTNLTLNNTLQSKINTSQFSNCTNLQRITINNTGVVYGDINSFTKCTSLIKLGLHRQKVTGSLDELATSQIANGRTSGTMLCECNSYDPNYPVTYLVNGEPTQVSYQMRITFDSSYTGGYNIEVVE